MKKATQMLISVLVFVMVVTVSQPVKSYNIMASDSDFSYVTVVDGNTQVYTTAKNTVEGFFYENGITLFPKDICDYFMSDNIHDGMVISIVRSMEVNVKINDVIEVRRVAAGTTIEQLLTTLQHELGIALLYGGDVSRGITDGETISLLTWQSEFRTVPEVIPYETLELMTSAVRDGNIYVRQEGVNGEQEVTTAVILIGGKEKEYEITDIVIISEPVDEIIDIGIGGRLGARVDTSAPDFHYRDKMMMNASAYTAGFSCTGKNPGDPGYGITASGRQVQPGIVSVDPNVIPLGTNLYVEGYGFSLAADTGGAIKGHKIDLFIEELEDALRFGRKNIMVYVLD